VIVTLELDGTTARLVVAVDGRGLQAGDRDRALAGGHIGLHSQELRVEAAGGTLSFEARQPRGTRARVELPVVTASEAVATAGHLTSPTT
jgi:signal transduction histidine kinase